MNNHNSMQYDKTWKTIKHHRELSWSGSEAEQGCSSASGGFVRGTSYYSGICCTTSPRSTLPLACLLRLMPSLPQVSHCLKKEAAPWASVCCWMLSAYSSFIGRAWGPLPPPTKPARNASSNSTRRWLRKNSRKIWKLQIKSVSLQWNCKGVNYETDKGRSIEAF